jgi:exoribonuclease R
MLLANITAAQQIAVALPEQALLRRHDAPIDRRLVRPRVLITLSRLMRSL